MHAVSTHTTKRESIIRYSLLLAVLVGYFAYLSWEYDVVTGGIVSLLTWSFFVLCTPIADAGFLIDFPVRLIIGIRMVVSEGIVWGIAIVVNLLAVNISPESYDKTFLTTLFYKILTTPWPYWGIILLSCGGTFLSICFGDEMLDVFQHKDRRFFHKHGFKHSIIVSISLIIMFVVAYYYLLESLGVAVPEVF